MLFISGLQINYVYFVVPAEFFKPIIQLSNSGQWLYFIRVILIDPNAGVQSNKKWNYSGHFCQRMTVQSNSKNFSFRANRFPERYGNLNLKVDSGASERCE
uniref:Uncharacterized protein n=1 Tax=Cacopsylla melanoneura TaxID=428564 RepID=A0A8D8TDZ6_9HEMI